MKAGLPETLAEVVEQGLYNGVTVKHSPALPEEREEAVLTEVLAGVKDRAPEELVRQKLNSLLAQAKLKLKDDPVYNVLADFSYILDQAYRAAGVARSLPQVQSEALDILLRTVSKDQPEVSKAYFYQLLKDQIGNYRLLLENFEALLENIIRKRKEENAAKTPEERLDQVFKAYLGSLNQNLELWLSNQRPRAEVLVLRDLLYDAVAVKEQLEVKDTEVGQLLDQLSQTYGVDREELEQRLDLEALRWQIRRDKARQLIIDRAHKQNL